ncbi:MAG: tRNA (adenosine(37)-N6)-dimethylallyltransferase MiaA [Candidatus Zambryskibacteria bacterium CG_4_9_14_3_um_filter_42_9]|nr:MAG: tRNA (adenosine(37)-N6)-dimethylallyltransferase MiaA [Candidatus Zambryskibacteria bacterium CG_4_9_14_3_um_filter_42_9]
MKRSRLKKKVLVIVGPTASGKSSLAVKLAQKFNGEIISADSRQVYKGLDIGTGKITKREMRGIPHHLLDVANPRKQFSASNFVSEANKAITMIYHSKHIPIVVGGTGFYIDALAGNISLPDVPPNKKLRERLDKKSAETLFKILKKKDLRRALAIDPHNKVRLIRALEIVEAVGKVPTLKSSSTYSFIYIGLKPDNLDQRIHKRLLKRLHGIIREAKKLIKLKAISYRRMHELGLEYRYAGMYLKKKISKEEMLEKLYTEIRRYAKRQMTWFKRNKKIKWLNPEKIEDIKKFVELKL